MSQTNDNAEVRSTDGGAGRAGSRLPQRAHRVSSRPLVSVIVPTYNRGATIRATLDSAFAQTYPFLEIVVVDDGSTDHTRQVLGDVSSSIVSIHQDNRGVAAARNAGINASRGSIVMFLDSDDLWLPQTVETQVNVLEAAGAKTPCVMCDLTIRHSGGGSVSMFENRRLRPRHAAGRWTNVQDILTTRFLFTNQTLAIRRESLESVGLFDQSLWVMEDFDLAMRLSTLGPWAYTDEALAIRCGGSPNSLTALAEKDPHRLNATVLAISRKMQTQRVPNSWLARSATAYTAKKADRGLRLGQPARPATRLFLNTQAFIEEELLERMFRNSVFYPRMKTLAF